MRLLSFSLLISSVSVSLFASRPAAAGVFTVGNINYNIETFWGTWQQAETLVTASPWWQDQTVAETFADVVKSTNGLFAYGPCDEPPLFYRSQCYDRSGVLHKGMYSPFFAVDIVEFRNNVAPITTPLPTLFVGASWTENPNRDAFGRLYHESVLVQYRTDTAPQHWAYAAETTDQPQPVTEPTMLFGLLGLSTLTHWGLRRSKHT